MYKRPTFEQLSQASILEVGDGYRAKNSELGGEGPIFLRSAYLQEHGFVRNMPERFREAGLKRFGSKSAQLGDVVVTTKGNSTGRVGVIRSEQVGTVYSPHLSYWRSKDHSRLDQRFLGFWSQSMEFQSQLAAMAFSTDMAPYLSLRDQRRLHISLPEIGQQRYIGKVLGSLDDKIELNRRMNETLEAMAQAIFRDWFVDFGPTRRKIEGVTDPVEIMGGLVIDPERARQIADLFPESIGANGLPGGWSTQSLLDQAIWVNGAAYKNMHFSEEDDALPVVKIAELKNGVTAATKRTNSQLGERYRISDGELLFSWSGNPDTSIDAFVWTGGEAWLNQHIFAVRGNGVRSRSSLYILLRLLKPEFAEIARNKQTTGLGHVTREDMKRLLVCCASNDVEVAFEKLVEPVVELLISKLFENRTLTFTRDLLLPKLMSGEICLRDAEAQLEAAQ